MLKIDNKEADNSVEINKESERFLENLFKRKLNNTSDLKAGGKKICDKEISE